MNSEEIIFALDIGTRSVVGIIGRQENSTFHILDVEIAYHPDRTMYDGQIHDVEGVVQVVKEIKKKLEERLGFPLQEVAIAAAGRALKTYRVQVDRLIDNDKQIDRSLSNNLEMEGLQIAQAMLEKDHDRKSTKYYCVGYTVVNYYLNDSIIGSLVGQKGYKIAADIIATFLPHVVVDSLYTVMDRVGLEVTSMTLEPIAAINVSIPPKARLLNLALVDIGAGTSDIALTKDGTIVAYAMASIAGDEITEELAKKYLLDFDAAETLKLNLRNSDMQNFSDIVGIEYRLKTGEILDAIAPAIQKLAKQITENILEYNGNSPSAVFLVGGGSQIPCLTEYLAENLSLPKERVVVRGTEIIQNVHFKDEKLQGPESITPVGIAVTAVKNREQNFLNVTVDGRKINLFNSRQLTVSDALVLISYNAKKLISSRGPSLNILVNNRSKVIPGEYGETGKVYLNGKLASLDSKINNGDEIIIEPATQGQEAAAVLRDVLPLQRSIFFNEQEVKLVDEIRLNGQEADQKVFLQEGDHLTCREINNLGELLDYLEYNYADYNFYVNGHLATLDYQLKNNDKIVSEEQSEVPLESAAIVEKSNLVAVPLPENMQTVTLTVNNESLTFQHDRKNLLLVDIFNYINFDMTKVQGQLELEINSNKASFTAPIKDGDIIRIYWT